VSTIGWVILAIVVVAVVAILVVAAAMRGRRRARLQQRFGPEYDRTVEASGSRRAAERELRERAERRDEINLRDLDPQRRQVLRGEWVGVQAMFVDDPRGALDRAARLVHATMSERGYPANGDDEHIDLVSVDHPDLVPEFRRAHDTSVRLRNGNTDTEAVRQGMLAYRNVFQRIVGAPVERQQHAANG
jgi:hypothetical protein